MANKYVVTANKLQKAINNTFDARILISTSQWYSEDRHAPITVYSVKQAITKDNGKQMNIELFKCYSALQLTLFLRDYWYELNGWEVPTDNQVWEEVKQKYGQTKKLETAKT